MPARATLFDAKCNKLAEFGKAARNTARWSPCSRLLALGGFGNLNGQIVRPASSSALLVLPCLPPPPRGHQSRPRVSSS
jgi:uncharacterized protein with WD repeat